MCAWSSSSFASLVAERDVSEESSAALSLFLSQCRFQDRHVTCRAIASGFSGPRETRTRTSILSFNFLLPVSNTLSLFRPLFRRASSSRTTTAATSIIESARIWSSKSVEERRDREKEKNFFLF